MKSRIEYITDSTGQSHPILDHSAFRDFKRLLPQNVEKCVAADQRFWLLSQILEQPEAVVDVIQRNYKVIGEVYHILAASMPSFPKIKLDSLNQIFLSKLGIQTTNTVV